MNRQDHGSQAEFDCSFSGGLIFFCQFDIFDRNDWEDGSSSDWSCIAALHTSAKRVVVAGKYNLPCFQLVVNLAYVNYRIVLVAFLQFAHSLEVGGKVTFNFTS